MLLQDRVPLVSSVLTLFKAHKKTNSTILLGVEILKECVSRPLDAIFVCCGGGGMLAGIAAYVKRVRPSTKVIGVEAEDAAGAFTMVNNELNTSLILTVFHFKIIHCIQA